VRDVRNQCFPPTDSTRTSDENHRVQHVKHREDFVQQQRCNDHVGNKGPAAKWSDDGLGRKTECDKLAGVSHDQDRQSLKVTLMHHDSNSVRTIVTHLPTKEGDETSIVVRKPDAKRWHCGISSAS
jgi:hypothetical protein